MALLHRLPQRVAHGHVPVDRQEVLPHAVTVRVQQPPRRRIDAEDGARLVQQHQSLVHAAGDLVKLLRPLPQLAHLPVDLAALVLHAPQQRRQLLVGIVLQRMLQIQPVQRLGDTPCQPPGQHARQDQRRRQHQQNGLQHVQHQHSRRHPDGGQTQHRAVRQPLGVVHGFLQQRTAVPAALALAGSQRLLYLLPLGVVLHGFRVGLCVVHHRAVRPHPCDAVLVGLQRTEIVRPVFLHAYGGQTQLVPQLGLLHPAEIAVQHAHHQRQTGDEHRHAHQQRGPENTFCHGTHGCALHR